MTVHLQRGLQRKHCIFRLYIVCKPCKRNISKLIEKEQITINIEIRKSFGGCLHISFTEMVSTLPGFQKGAKAMERTYEIPIWRKYTLSVEEAAVYFRIGENKLRSLINEDKNADYLLWNGNRVQIKRTKFEQYIDKLEVI